MTFKTIERELSHYLEKIPETRADDMVLYSLYCFGRGADLSRVMQDREYRLRQGLGSFESVGRIRRKIQKKRPDLRPTAEEIRKRREAEKEYKEYAKSK